MAPSSRSSYVVVGAGIHGLSTAYHLAKELRTRKLGSGRDVLVLDKSTPGAGASGIACGVVRNNYFQPAMSELMQACVEVWESDPAAYHYNPVGYMALGAVVQESDLTAVYERQHRIGYRSELILGEAAVDAHMKALFPDWRAKGVTVCLHEHQGGFAFNMDSVLGLAGKCESEDVSILSGIEVMELELGSDGTVTSLGTNEGRIEVGEQLVLAPGPWAKHFWALLELPMAIDIHTPSGDVVKDRPMWTYWNLQEGEIRVDPLSFATADGGARRSSTSTPTRLCTRTTGSSSPTSSGVSTSSATGTASRAAAPRSSSGRTSSSTPIPRRRTSIPVSRTCGAPRSRMRSAASRVVARSTGTRALAASAHSPPTTSRCSIT